MSTGLAIKTAVTVATDKRTWKVVGSVLIIILALMYFTISGIATIFGNLGQSNKQALNYLFSPASLFSIDSWSLHSDYNAEIKAMKNRLLALQSTLEDINAEVVSGAIDVTMAKVIYLCLFSEEPHGSYRQFALCFLDTNDDGEFIAVGDYEGYIYPKIERIFGIEITQENKDNIVLTYDFVMSGGVFVGDGSGVDAPSFANMSEAFAALMAEATKYLGYPYVWGGSNPQTSFDCSGFVCWAYTQSGVYNLPRTTAQGIYNECTKITYAEAVPGDLIFFTKTYKSENPVTHVGIYVGEDKMLHCGDPISYADINSNFWQKHYYGWGRLN